MLHYTNASRRTIRKRIRKPHGSSVLNSGSGLPIVRSIVQRVVSEKFDRRNRDDTESSDAESVKSSVSNTSYHSNRSDRSRDDNNQRQVLLQRAIDALSALRDL